MTSDLTSFGLNTTDAQVYEFLLKRGQFVGASKVATALNLHRQYVHASLQKLVSLNLVERIDGPRPKYQALPPRYLTQLARKQYEETERVARELEQISNVGADQEFEIFRGRKQIVDSETNLVHELPHDTTQYIIGGGSKTFIDFMGPEYAEIAKVAAEHGLKTLYIGSHTELPRLAQAISLLRDFEVRTMSDWPETSVQTVIRLNTVTFYSFGNPPLVYVLKSKTVYEDYKKFFFVLWNKAKPT